MGVTRTAEGCRKPSVAVAASMVVNLCGPMWRAVVVEENVSTKNLRAPAQRAVAADVKRLRWLASTKKTTEHTANGLMLLMRSFLNHARNQLL